MGTVREIVIRYVYKQTSAERVIEYVKYDKIEGEAVGNIIKQLHWRFMLPFSSLSWCGKHGRKTKSNSSKFPDKNLEWWSVILSLCL